MPNPELLVALLDNNGVLISNSNPLATSASGGGGGASSSVFANQAGTWNVGVTGTVAVTQSGVWTVTANAGSGTFTVAGTVTANAGSGTFTVAGTTTANQGAPASKVNAWPTILTDSAQNQAAITAVGALKVDGSAVTQPVSGTVTANAGSGTFTVSGTVTANAGSGTFTVSGTTTANQGTPAVKANAWPIILTDSVQNQAAITAAAALKVDGSAVTQPVSGTVTANAGSGTFTVGGTVTANAGTGTFAVDGPVATGSTYPSNPVPIGLSDSSNLIQPWLSLAAVDGVALPKYGAYTLGQFAFFDAGLNQIKFQRAASDMADNLSGHTFAAFGQMIYNGATFERLRDVASASNTTGTGAVAAGVLAFDGTNYQVLQVESASNKNLRVGLYNGANVLFPATAALTDSMANPTLTQVQAFPSVFNGTTWDRSYEIPSASGSAARAGAGFSGIALWSAAGNVAPLANANVLGDANTMVNTIGVGPLVFNGSTWDRWRSVTSATGTTGTGVPGVGNMLWDLVGTTNFVKQAGDGSGRAMVVGAAAAGAASAGNPVAVGIQDATGKQQYVAQVDPAGADMTGVGIVAANLVMRAGTSVYRQLANASASGDGSGQNILPIATFALNGGNQTWDRARLNSDFTLLSSAARTTTQTSADQTAYNCLGVVVTLDVTAITSTCSLTVTINYKDLASGKYITLLTGAVVSGVSTNRYRVDPRLTNVANLAANDDLGRVFQVVVTVGNANSQTYSLGMTLIPG